MVYVQKAFNVLSLFFFIPLVFIGAFFLLNLTLVVIKYNFTEEHEAYRERKKHSKFIMKKLTKEDIKKQAEAKVAFKKIKIKNKKIRDIKHLRRDSDCSKAESRHRKNLEKINKDESFIKQSTDIKPESRAMTAKSSTQGAKKMRPLFGISGLNNKNKNNVFGDPITEEMSNSELSLMNHNNIFYPTNLSANGANDSTHGANNNRNVLYLKKGKGKIKMEGMYGISRMHDVDGNNDLGSNSDLLEEIPISNEDDEIDNGEDNEPVLPDSEIMFPLDSSLSETSKTRKKNSDSKPKGDIQNKETDKDKAGFCISDSSYDFEENDSKLSPDKYKNMDRKNTNYFTATNLSSIDNNELKNAVKKNGLMKGFTVRKNSKGDEIDAIKGGNKNTKVSSKIEGGSAFDKIKSKVLNSHNSQIKVCPNFIL